jgi:hypothetical protein
VLSGHRIRGRASKRGAFKLSIILNPKLCFGDEFYRRIRRSYNGRAIGIYVVFNCCSVMLNKVRFQSSSVCGNCYCLVCKNCPVLEVMLFVFFSFGQKCLCNREEYRLRRK